LTDRKAMIYSTYQPRRETMFNTDDFKAALTQLKSAEGRDEAVKWFLLNVELVEEALEIAGEGSPLKASIAKCEAIARGEF